MRGVLVRVGVDQAYGHWNGPVDPRTNEFVYVSIPEDAQFQPGMETPYARLRTPLDGFVGSRMCERPEKVGLPAALSARQMHLDPDFERLTYGDTERRGKDIAGLSAGDLLVFYAGLRPCRPCAHKLVYAIIGVYAVAEVVRVEGVEPGRWADNAHTRRLAHRATDLIVRAQPGASGRLEKCIPIGEFRRGAYRVREDLLEAWGGLSCLDGFIQRSAVPPKLLAPERFASWFAAERPVLVPANNPAKVGS